MTSFTVEPPASQDTAIWRELYGAYADFCRASVTDAQLDLLWCWITDSDHDIEALTVRDPAGTVVGLAHYRPYFRPLAAAVAGRWITADDNHRARRKYDRLAERATWVTYDMHVPQTPD